MKQLNFSKNVNINLLNSMHNLFEHGARRANNCVGDTYEEKNARVCKDGGYKCIHLPAMDFCDRLGSMLEAEKIDIDTSPYKHKFLDIGCGVGEKIYLASLFGLYHSYGLELREPLIQEGKQLLESISHNCSRWDYTTSETWTPYGNNNCFIQANALTFDYKDFDILYFYCPLHKSELQCQLEARIAETAKPGAIVMAILPYGVFATGSDFGNWQCRSSGNYRYFVKKGA